MGYFFCHLQIPITQILEKIKVTLGYTPKNVYTEIVISQPWRLIVLILEVKGINISRKDNNHNGKLPNYLNNEQKHLINFLARHS